MDKMDRMLHSLPGDNPSPDLVSRIQLSIRRRQRRRRIIRWTAAGLFSLSGLWLILPAVAGFSSFDLFSSGMPWLISSADYLNLESIPIVDGLWNGMFSLQNNLSSSLVVSIWFGALLLCVAIFLSIDGQAFTLPAHSARKYQN